MSVRRWVIKDPYDTDPATNKWTFIRNPREMTSIYLDRPIVAQPTTAGNKILLWEGPKTAKEWSFSGPVLEKVLFDELRRWVYKRRRLVITDHYGRNISTVLKTIDLVPKRRVNIYYSHEYTVTGLILAVSEPTATDLGPGVF